MTNYTYQIYKNTPFRYTLKKAQNYTVKETKIATGTSISLSNSFESNSGITASLTQKTGNPMVVHIPEGTFPNRETVPASLGCLAPYGKSYLVEDSYSPEYLQNHGCSISTFGNATGFSTENYLYLNRQFKNTGTISFIFGAVQNDMTATNPIFATSTGKKIYFDTSGHYSVQGTTTVTGTSTLAQGRSYFFGGSWDGTTFRGYTYNYSTSYSLDNPPDFSTWTLEWEINENILENAYIYYGYDPSGSNYYWHGTIYLKRCKIWVNNRVFNQWQMTEETTDIYPGLLTTGLSDTGTATNYYLHHHLTNNNFLLDTSVHTTGTDEWFGAVSSEAHTPGTAVAVTSSWNINGNVEIDKTWLKNFSAANYIKTNYKFAVSSIADAFVIQIKIHTPATFSNANEALLDNGTYGPKLGINATTHTLYAYLDNQQLNGSVVNSTNALQADTDYWVRLSRTSGDFFTNPIALEISADGTNFSQEATLGVISGAITADEDLILGCTASSPYTYFTGAINFYDTYIKINNQTTWSLLENA